MSESIEEITALDPLDVPSRLNEFKDMEDGWLEGGGVAPDPFVLDRVAHRFTSYYPRGLPLPYAYPTPEGGVQFEWTIGPNSSSLEIDREGDSAEWHNLNFDTDESDIHTLRLDSPEGWNWLAGAISRLVSSMEGNLGYVVGEG